MNRLIKITDGNMEVGILPGLGGTVALFRIIGKPNVFKFDEAVLDRPPPVRRRFGPNPAWKAYNGHTVWLGPQSEWWAHQTKNLKKYRERSVWPPDPYINNGYYEVTEQSASHVVMAGPNSEFSGVRLTKTVKIKNKKVYFHVSAQNIRDVPVSWDLWLNTRVDGYAYCYAPVASINKVRIEGEVTNTRDMSIYEQIQCYYTTVPRAPSKKKVDCAAKAFIPARRGFMAAFTNGQALIIKFKKHTQKLIHPEHALVEFYNYTSHNREDALTELEYHAPYITLSPGELMETSQIWELYPFNNKPNHERCIDFLAHYTGSVAPFGVPTAW